MFFRVLFFALLAYLIYSWVKRLFFTPDKKKQKQNKEVRIFKTKEVEKSKYNLEAEEVAFEEINEPPKDEK